MDFEYQSRGEMIGPDPAMTVSADYLKPKLLCYELHDGSPSIVSARPERQWMDGTPEHFAYRCIPLAIANSSGWEILCPDGFTAEWNGGDSLNDITVESHSERSLSHFVASHFGSGVLTFHPGYLFRTSPGWALWVRGAPNTAKSNCAPLDGLVETDWLPFTFTMNWRFSKPGKVHFERGEPFCFITLFPHALIDDVQPEILRLDDNPDLKADFENWAESRNNFNKRLSERDPEAVAAKWQKTYAHGKQFDGSKVDLHLAKRRLKQPRKV